MFYGTKVIGTWSDLVGPISAVVVTRKNANGEKLFVDVTLACEQDIKATNYGKTLARTAARRFGATSMDHSKFDPILAERKVSDGQGRMHTVHLRRTTYVFSAV